MAKAAEMGNVVESFKIGNTQVFICDDYCVKTREEVDAILNRIARNALAHFSAVEAEKRMQVCD